MDTAGAAAKFRALDAELTAKSSRVAELEARVSLLEAENARLRKALACPAAGDEDPKSGRLAAVLLRGSKRGAAEKPGGSAACDVIEVSDDELEEGVTVDASSKGRGPEEEGVAAVPTPRNRAVLAVTAESEEEDDAEGGGGISGGNSGGVGLEDDDVLVSPRGRKRAAARARVVTSDSEDEDANDGEDGVDAQEEGGKPSKKRGLCGICDIDDEDATEGVNVVALKAASPAQIASGEDEDDTIPICQVLKKMRKESVRYDDGDDELGEAKGCSTPPTRHSARLVKNQSKVGRAARQVLNFVEPKETEGSEEDTEKDDDMEDFINDDDSSENAVESAEESCDESEVSVTSDLNEESSPGPEESDSDVDYADVMACIGHKKNAKDWKFEGDMLAAFDEHPELCLKAVCALYRRQTEEEQMHKATIVHNKQGFSQIHAPRASRIAEFLLDGDLYGPVKKTISDLEEYDRYALEFCRRMASHYSKQLFAIYQNKEDLYFHP